MGSEVFIRSCLLSEIKRVDIIKISDLEGEKEGVVEVFFLAVGDDLVEEPVSREGRCSGIVL